MGDNANWDKLPSELMEIIGHRLSSIEDYVKLSVVSKSWQSGLNGYEKPLLPSESPILFLAEQVAEGGVLSCDFDDEYEEGLQEDKEIFENVYNFEEDAFEEYLPYDDRKNSVGSTRGLYRLATGKTCYIELLEASGKLIVGTNQGFLVTVGRDLQVNLLHPLLRQQIPLPPIDTFPFQWSSVSPEEEFHQSIRKVAISSEVRGKYAVVDKDKCWRNPIVMAIYGIGNDLAFARLGDKEWTNVKTVSNCNHDIACYKGKFYAVDYNGAVFLCDIDDDGCSTGRQASVTEIALCPYKGMVDFDQWYLVESRSCLWLVMRIRKLKHFKPPHHLRIKYRTSDFRVWKLELKYSDDRLETPLYTCTEKNNLGEEALFIGRATCLSLPSSEYIKSNCIYFTDDNWQLYEELGGGGHDMGIFNMEDRTIEPHFQGKSIHPVSPPLWYI